jgi:hypothetical protein
MRKRKKEAQRVLKLSKNEKKSNAVNFFSPHQLPPPPHPPMTFSMTRTNFAGSRDTVTVIGI